MGKAKLQEVPDGVDRYVPRITDPATQQQVRWAVRQFSLITMIEHCSILGDFLAFLYQAGSTSSDLSTAVVSPKTYRHERSPRFLSRDEIQAVLRSVDRNTPIGRRDYAMLLLLSTYGLRGIEVVRMKLEDLDWKTARNGLTPSPNPKLRRGGPFCSCAG